MQPYVGRESYNQEQESYLEETADWIKHLQWLGIKVEKPETR